MAQRFKDLVVWQRAMDMVVETYKLTDSFPKRFFWVLSTGYCLVKEVVQQEHTSRSDEDE